MTKEKVLLVVVDLKQSGGWPAEDVARELQELVTGCGGEVVETAICRIEKPTAATLIGSGKVQDLAEICALTEIDTVIFSHELKGSQKRNLEEVLEIRTIDRTQLILDIFARHAVSQEGKMQVELAQLQYLLPRLVGQGSSMSRLGGGIGTLGPGETKLEVDRRRISQRIDRLKKNLAEVSQGRAVKRKKRKDQAIPLLSLVGYTNAGKSTLLNTLTDAGQVTRDGLFTTLDSLSRQWVLSNHQKVILSDTVGFMHDLPHHLIESFKATLEEVTEADLLLHVLDVSDPKFRSLHAAVIEVLKELSALDKPIITVLNKVDQVPDQGWMNELKSLCQNPVPISARTGLGLEQLRQVIEVELSSLIVNLEVVLPIDRMDLIHLAHRSGQVLSVKYYNDRMHLRAALPTRLAGVFRQAGLPAGLEGADAG